MARSDRVTGPLQAFAPKAGRYRLLVVADNAVLAVHVLPEVGDITIGRGHDNTIQIDDESISRRHAVLHIARMITIEDLGSSNGTKLREVRIPPNQPRELGVNELVTIGALTLIIQAKFAPAQTGRMATHDYFQNRLEEECARAERGGAQFAVVGIRVSGSATDRAVVEALMATLRQSDVLAKFGEHTYELLLVDATRAQAEHVAGRLVASLELVDATATYTVASFPTDGRSAYALMAQITGLGDEGERSVSDLVIADQAMRDLYALAERIASSDLAVLILGETGVGKEKMAQTVHKQSPRNSKPFVAINCAALNDSLLESELFGHERGAFTGANSVKPGLLESAAGGTVFLDEIGDMSLAIQAKLLRVLEEGEVRRVGGLKPRKIGVRFIAATNTDLEAATGRGRFREDLYFRLSAATLVIPPLRERPTEIALLARRFAMRVNGSTRVQIDVSPEALTLLQGYSWPGNIRELRNVIERAVLLCGAGPIGMSHLPVEKMRGTFVRAIAQGEVETTEISSAASEDERARVLDALERAGGNQSKAASLLGVSRRTLINRMDQFNLPRPRKGRRADADADTVRPRIDADDDTVLRRADDLRDD